MCGIAGLINLTGSYSLEDMRSYAAAMSESLRHRGPDDCGVWVDPQGYCAFAQRRLSVIDLSPLGHQPMIDDNTGAVLTFNGEIYNYQELQSMLSAQGQLFKSLSDTEVLLKGISLQGSSFLQKLDGMYAFAYYDPSKRTVLLARDPFGEKPLYYARTQKWFAFASELQALTILPDFENHITFDRLTDYLALQYIPAPLTIYKGASKLKPGSTLTLDNNGHETISQHFRFNASAQQKSNRTLDDLADELDQLLVDTIRNRLIADVPLGAFLSGGVDSSLVCALAMKVLKNPLQTFSIGFEGSDDSEHHQARQMAHHLRTFHRDQILPIETIKLGKHIASVLDEPNGDTSCLPTWILSRMTRQHVTVALSGDGGDELFGGYNRYKRTLQDSALEETSWKAGASYYSPRILIFGDQALGKFIGNVPTQTQALLGGLRQRLDETKLPLLQRLRETDIENYLPGAVLAKVDRMSMQHALEIRAPLLGRKVADFAMRSAANDLCTETNSKIILKQVAARYIPRSWLERPKKGFGLPLQAWGDKAMADTVFDLLSDPQCCLAQWIDADARRRFIDYHHRSPVLSQLWAVFILEEWLQCHNHRAA